MSALQAPPPIHQVRVPMHFLSPDQLWFLALVPLVVALYVWLLRQRKISILRYPSLGLARHALNGAAAWRRHVPPGILLGAIVSMVVAGARPAMEIAVPVARKTIVLAMDVSGSMQAADVSPTRLVASQSAAKASVAQLPESARVAVVAYAGSAYLVQAPTSSRADVIEPSTHFSSNGQLRSEAGSSSLSLRYFRMKESTRRDSLKLENTTMQARAGLRPGAGRVPAPAPMAQLPLCCSAMGRTQPESIRLRRRSSRRTLAFASSPSDLARGRAA